MTLSQLIAELRRLRRRAGLNQTELGQRIGLTRVQIGNIENGHSGTTIDRLEEWAQALNRRIEYVVVQPGRDDLALRVLRLLPQLTEVDRAALASLISAYERAQRSEG